MTPDERLALQIHLRAEIQAAKEMIVCLEHKTDDYSCRQRLTYYRGMTDAFERMLGWVVLPAEGLR
jgi:hypothetical protein